MILYINLIFYFFIFSDMNLIYKFMKNKLIIIIIFFIILIYKYGI